MNSFGIERKDLPFPILRRNRLRESTFGLLVYFLEILVFFSVFLFSSNKRVFIAARPSLCRFMGGIMIHISAFANFFGKSSPADAIKYGLVLPNDGLEMASSPLRGNEVQNNQPCPQKTCAGRAKCLFRSQLQLRFSPVFFSQQALEVRVCFGD